MKKVSKSASPHLRREYIIRVVLAVLVLAALLSIGTVMAKYISTKNATGEITPMLFYVDGDYAEKIESGDSAPEINVSGWRENGIVLKLQNYEGDNVSQFEDFTYTIKDISGWSISESKSDIGGGKKEVTVTLTPSDTAKRGDRINFELTTSPYAVTMKATFVLTDSNKPDWKLQDMGEYTLLTVYSNDYEGSVTVNYSGDVFAPDSTNALMNSWVRSENATGSFSVERFMTYELRLFEEVSGEYTFYPQEGTGNTVTVKTAP